MKPALVRVFGVTGMLLLMLLQYGNSPIALAASGSALSGVWSDSCPCKVPCPCWRTGQANAARCLNVQIYSAKQPNAPDKQGQSWTFVFVGVPEADFDAPSPYRVYLNQDAPPVLVDEMTSFFRRNYGAKAEIFEHVPIKADIQSNHHSVSIANTLEYEVAESAGKPLAREVEDYLYPWLSSPAQWETKKVRYKLGNDWKEYEASNSLAASFSLELENKADAGSASQGLGQGMPAHACSRVESK